MDYLKHSEPEAENSCRLSHNSHRIIKFLLSVSLLSALISLRPLFLQSLKPFLMQLDSYTIGKSYLFILCNGILILIFKNSGLINGSNHSRELNFENPEGSWAELKVLESEEPNLEIEYPEENKSLIRVSGSEQDNEEWCNNAFEIIGEDELDAGEREELKKNCEELILREDDVGAEYPWLEAEEEGDDDGVSGAEEDWLEAEETEELNKKCEKFIRKMKTAFFRETIFEYNSGFDNQKALAAVEC